MLTWRRANLFLQREVDVRSLKKKLSMKITCKENMRQMRKCKAKSWGNDMDMIRECNRITIEANKKWVEWRERLTSTWHNIRDHVDWNKVT